MSAVSEDGGLRELHEPDASDREDDGRIVLRLDRIMVERGRSLNWLAAQVGITNVNLSKIKNNRVSAIRFSTLAAICEALDCQPGDILEYVRD
ncbi:XRE family transcriptional regulator [Bifidobacterium sp. DSM 109959]|uniref:XRE family transcriptional regulator n=1 Tax=Bifidobacterium olomucense TaxID=2675324 RepID=A0A7Y0EYJ2_9BIFI|nr:XRE family transcriptional regulator [Bifidobacterium sp. DSM 109959]